MKKLKSLSMLTLCVICISLFFSCEKEEIESDILNSKNSPIEFWSPWLASNPNGTVRPSIIVPDRSNNSVYLIRAREQAGYGIVNLQLEAKDDSTWLNRVGTNWATTNQRGVSKSAPILYSRSYATGIQLKEQYGYGIVDARLFGNVSNTISRWVTRNPNVNEYHTYNCPSGYKIVGAQAKEQAGYGIVDIRVLVRKI